MDKTAICSIVVLDVIDFLKKSSAEQSEIKKQIEHQINLAVIDIPAQDRTVIHTEQGVIVACSGSSEDSLEDALLISLTIRDEILKNNMQSLKPLYLQLGINLGWVRVSTNEEGVLEIVGEGLDEAKRIMSFANPNQILVSRMYYEMASKLTQDVANMFEQYDMHAHEQDIYAVRLLKDRARVGGSTVMPLAEVAESTNKSPLKNENRSGWKYMVLVILVMPVLFLFAKWVLNPIEPAIIMEQAPLSEANNAPPVAKPVQPPLPSAMPEQEVKPVQEEVVVAEPPVKEALVEQVTKPSIEPTKKKNASTQKKDVQKPIIKQQYPSKAEKPEKPVANTHENQSAVVATPKSEEQKVEKNVGNKNNATSEKKSGWQTFKDSVTNGAERNCTQGEIAMGQCRN